MPIYCPMKQKKEKRASVRQKVMIVPPPTRIGRKASTLISLIIHHCSVLWLRKKKIKLIYKKITNRVFCARRKTRKKGKFTNLVDQILIKIATQFCNFCNFGG